MAFGRYTHAIVCRVPSSCKKLTGSLIGEINIEKARKEHEEYCRTLRKLDLDVIELPPDESLPDCAFVDDIAIICNGTALICRPGSLPRQKEVEIIRATIKKELEIPIVEIADPKGAIYGSDVLFTGREFFVGLSAKTNEAGARALAAAFPEYPVTPVKVPSKLHLKSVVSMSGPDIICVSSGAEAQSILKQMEREATFKYQTVTVPDDEAANCLYVNGTLIHRAEYQKSCDVFENKIDYQRVPLTLSELSKASCGLSSLAILIKKSRYF